MRRFFIPEVVLGLLLATALWSVVSLFVADPQTYHQICETDQYGHEHCTEHNALYVVWWYVSYAINAGTITALATAAIAWFTLTLRRSTDKLWKAGEQQFTLAKETSQRQAVEIENQIDIAREANRAAQKSADAAVASERARFYIVVKRHNLNEILRAIGQFPNSPTMSLAPHAASIEYSFKNYGKTPGIISEVSHGLEVHHGPPDPVYAVSDHLFVEHMIAAGGYTEQQKFDGPILFDTVADGLPLVNGEKHFWFYGRFDYEDVFGNPQVHRWLIRYVKTGLKWGFQPYDYKHYNKSS